MTDFEREVLRADQSFDQNAERFLNIWERFSEPERVAIIRLAMEQVTDAWNRANTPQEMFVASVFNHGLNDLMSRYARRMVDNNGESK